MMSRDAESLRAGAAEVDITPWAGVQLSGAVGQKRSAHMIGDRLYARGGHECAVGNWSRFAPGALEVVVDESVRLLKEMFPGEGT